MMGILIRGPAPVRKAIPAMTSRIHCANCKFHWTMNRGSSLYEQQTVESTPCPKCGAYTLSLTTSAADRKEKSRRLGRRIQPRDSTLL